MLSTAKRSLISAHHVAPHRTSRRARAPPVRPAGRAAPRLASPPHGPDLGEASERARVWFTDLLLPASQVVYMKSTL